MRIMHNLASLNIFKQQSRVLERQNASLARISSGYKVNKTKDDPNAIAESNRLRMHIRGLEMATRNVQDGVSMLQAADGALSSISDTLIRVRELTVKAGNATNTDEDKKIIQSEIDELMKGIDQMSYNTEFNGVKLIGNDKVLSNDSPIMRETAVGSNPDEKVSIPMYNVKNSMILGNIDVTSSDGAGTALAAVDNAISAVSSIRSKYGALENRFESSYNNLQEIGEKLQGAESNIRDTDIAEEMMEYAKYNILAEAGTAMMAQSNRFPQDVLKILENMRR